ncbi:MAG TPA: SMI1/KNR4 family protein [Phycisphaerae bacterium]|nr:SMI1/KNR4 family protein [Phycisphaerae bacterium]
MSKSDKWQIWTGEMTTSAGATQQALRTLQGKARVELPEDYLDFLGWSNGAEGDIGPNFIQIWPTERIAANPYPFEEFVPGLLFMASDGGAALFGFDTRAQPMPIVVTHSDDLILDTLVTVAPSFSAFLEFLTNHDWIEYWSDRRGTDS